ncbi:MAG: gamma-glutamylcyclotransferase [Candidatus Binatia bacterium]|nr:gamma-glutamylcyclotransferase [Candidatus Binatia bacterium]
MSTATPTGGAGRAVFTYGTLMFPVVMDTVTGQTLESHRASLAGFQRFGVSGEVYPGIVEAEGKTTLGRLYLAVDDDTLAVLDRFEDWLYERRTLEVELKEGGSFTAEVWMVPERYADRLDGRPWDPFGFMGGDLEAYLESCRAFRIADRDGTNRN